MRSKIFIVLADATAIAAAMTLATWIRSAAVDTPEPMAPTLVTAIFALPVWLGVFACCKLYTPARAMNLTDEISRVVNASAIAALGTGLISFGLGTEISRVWLLLTFVTAVGTVGVERAFVWPAFWRARWRARDGGHRLQS